MSELEGARRLPVFVDEDQWARAFQAAKQEVEALECAGLLLPQTVESRRTVATRIATAALRAAAQDDTGDIGDVAGVHIDEIGSHTATGTGRPEPRDRHRYRNRDRSHQNE